MRVSVRTVRVSVEEIPRHSPDQSGDGDKREAREQDHGWFDIEADFVCVQQVGGS